MSKLDVVAKGDEERDGLQVYTVTVTRSGVDRVVEVTQAEARALHDRENLRASRLNLQLQEAALDGRPTDLIVESLGTATSKAQELRGVLSFMISE